MKCACGCGGILEPARYPCERQSRGDAGGERRFLHGHQGRTHGYASNPLYAVWANMKQRCLNPNNPAYHNYGGRGITVCDAWIASFEQFLADMGERADGLTLDRVDNDGNYEPGNCRWATRLEQNQNRRAA